MKGIFKLKTTHTTPLIGKNTIMNVGRNKIQKIVQGIEEKHYISRLILGTDGYNGGNSPAVVDASRINTFSEANGSDYYYIDFSINPSDGTVTVVDEEGNPSTNSTVTLTADDTAFTLTYNFHIPRTNGNGSSVRKYSEAALYLNDGSGNYTIYSMKTFNERTKDNTIDFDIEWILVFG